MLAVERDGHRADAVPAEIGRLLQQVLSVMARGGTVTIGSVPDVVTTTTAAGILGVSRPTLMKMIEEGTIAAHKVGTHHRLRVWPRFPMHCARRARERAAFAKLLDLKATKTDSADNADPVASLFLVGAQPRPLGHLLLIQTCGIRATLRERLGMLYVTPERRPSTFNGPTMCLQSCSTT